MNGKKKCPNIPDVQDLIVYSIEVVRVMSKITSYHCGGQPAITGVQVQLLRLLLWCLLVVLWTATGVVGAIKSLSSEYLVPQTVKEKIRPKNYCVRDGKH